MPNVMRWRYGDTNPRMMRPHEMAAIYIGDLVAEYEGSIRPFDEVALESDEATLAHLVEHFVGVAMQCSLSGESEHIRVATTGVFEFPCHPEAILAGDRLTVFWSEDGGSAYADRVKRTTASALAIGRCAHGQDASDKVLMSFSRRDCASAAVLS